ncbi:uncharacterized protein LOC128397421 [Panonychus citri]|uniref:uncharacterized protein LOC128397421 n=1 Tax=Panonychus citri TaxID=50023 RepID=UPI002307D811|nr:uncharacterized protein LOC128397421 [Panonychus citri]
MDYLHHLSVPATKSELELFHVPPTQTAIESYYEVEYRPSATLDNAKNIDISIPASDDFTDLSETMIYVKLSLKTTTDTDVDITKVNICDGFAAALFEQIDFYLGSVNIGQSNNLYPYQAYIEDLLFGVPSKIDVSSGWDLTENRKDRIKKPFDLYFRLHIPMCSQDNLLLNGVPMLVKLNRANIDFGLLKTPPTGTDPIVNYKLTIQDLSITVRRVKLFSNVNLGIQEALEKGSSKYFITRNDMKSFIIPKSNTSISFESIFNGILPRRMIIGFVGDDFVNGKSVQGPFHFGNQDIKSISCAVNGNLIPTNSYNPDFENNLYMKEYVGLYRYLNQHEGVPMCAVSFKDYKEKYCLFAFDLSPDVTIGGETGTLSLLKRGNIKIEVKFKSATTYPIHMIVFAQFDNLVEIDKYRNVSIDW